METVSSKTTENRERKRLLKLALRGRPLRCHKCGKAFGERFTPPAIKVEKNKYAHMEACPR